MVSKVTFTSNKAAVQRKMEANIDRALTAIGEEAVGLVVSQMQRVYGKPIRQTGTLMRSITHERASPRTEAVGTNVKYATFVHHKIKGRPYLKDGILNSPTRLVMIMQQS